MTQRVMRLLVLASSIMLAAPDTPRQTSGHYQVTLRLPADGLFAEEEMQLEFRVEDTARPDPITGFIGVIRATPQATIDMPEMPSMPKFSETAHAEGAPGDYGIHPTFGHGGRYRLRIAVNPPAGDAFTVEFPLDVKDADKGSRRKPAPPRFTVEVVTQPKKPKSGETTELRLTVRDRDNANAVVTAFDTAHEALMHLILVRRDLAEFSHEHPEAGADGSFRLPYQFASGGEYHLFADTAPKGAGGQILSARINVLGAETAAFHIQQAWKEQTGAAASRETGDCRVTLHQARDVRPVRKTVVVEFQIDDLLSGRPAEDLQPYLGAAGHLMLVHEDAATFVHSHPEESDAEPQAGRLRFLARFPKPGLYRGWLQIRRGGKVLTTDFLMLAAEQP